MKEVPGSEFEVEADLVFLAMGFLGPVKNGMLDELGVELDARGNVKADQNKMTSIPGVFTAGDMTRGRRHAKQDARFDVLGIATNDFLTQARPVWLLAG